MTVDRRVKYVLPDNHVTTLRVAPEVAEAVRQYALLTGYTVTEATFRLLQSGMYLEMLKAQKAARDKKKTQPSP